MVMTCECFRFMCIINFLLESSNWPHWLQASWLWVVKHVHVHVHVHRVAKRWEVETIPHNFFSATTLLLNISATLHVDGWTVPAWLQWWD